MVRQPRGQKSGDDTPPTSYPQITPPSYAQPTHDFTLQTVVQLQHSVGELIAKVDRLISDTKSQGEKIDAVRMKMSWVAGGASVVGFFLATLIAVAVAAIKLLPTTGK